MPVKGLEPIIEIREGIELVAIKCIRNMVEIFKYPSGEIGVKSKWRLFKVKSEPDMPEILVYDDAGYITKGHSNYALKPIEDVNWIEEWLNEVPGDIKEKLKNIAQKHGLGDKNLSKSLSKILMTPIPRLKNPETVAKMTKEQWDEFIESVISPDAEKDHRLKLIFKTHLLRGIMQRYNPHSLLITNSGTGKTTYYDIVGLTIDKASKNRLIGFADAQNARPGVIDNLNVVLCIEQIESQTAPDILAFLLSFMESGKARSETGGYGITVRGECPIVITANPTGYSLDRIDTFRALIDHLTGNLMALGRRFGIIVYGNDYQKVTIKKPFSSVEWQKNVQKFRSIEEYVLPPISQLFSENKICKWLETPLPGYEERGKKLIGEVKDQGVKDFLTMHFELAYPHIRGAALNCAIIDFIPMLVKVKTTGEEDSLLIIELLATAEEYLKEIITINLESIANMASAEEDVTELIFAQLPKYVQELILAVNQFRQKNPTFSREVSLDVIEQHSLNQYYPYFSAVSNHLDYITPETLSYFNSITEKYWWFRTIQKDKGVYTIEFVR